MPPALCPPPEARLEPDHPPSRPNSLRCGPDARGRFGGFGGRFVAETLMPLVLAVEAAYDAAKRDPAFQAELDRYLRDYVGRPSPLWFAERLTKRSAARRSTSSATS